MEIPIWNVGATIASFYFFSLSWQYKHYRINMNINNLMNMYILSTLSIPDYLFVCIDSLLLWLRASNWSKKKKKDQFTGQIWDQQSSIFSAPDYAELLNLTNPLILCLGIHTISSIANSWKQFKLVGHKPKSIWDKVRKSMYVFMCADIYILQEQWGPTVWGHIENLHFLHLKLEINKRFKNVQYPEYLIIVPF